MRTDAQIDRKQVYLPNASTLGFGKWKAQHGDVVLYTQNDQNCIGRVAGRVHYAPSLEPNEKPIKDYLLVIQLGSRLDFSYERWVNPADVTECFDPHNEYCRIQEVLAFMFSKDFKKESVETLRRFAGEWSTPAKMREWQSKRDADIKEYNSRKE